MSHFLKSYTEIIEDLWPFEDWISHSKEVLEVEGLQLKLADNFIETLISC